MFREDEDQLDNREEGLPLQMGMLEMDFGNNNISKRTTDMSIIWCEESHKREMIPTCALAIRHIWSENCAISEILWKHFILAKHIILLTFLIGTWKFVYYSRLGITFHKNAFLNILHNITYNTFIFKFINSNSCKMF